MCKKFRTRQYTVAQKVLQLKMNEDIVIHQIYNGMLRIMLQN